MFLLHASDYKYTFHFITILFNETHLQMNGVPMSFDCPPYDEADFTLPKTFAQRNHLYQAWLPSYEKIDIDIQSELTIINSQRQQLPPNVFYCPNYRTRLLSNLIVSSLQIFSVLQQTHKQYIFLNYPFRLTHGVRTIIPLLILWLFHFRCFQYRRHLCYSHCDTCVTSINCTGSGHSQPISAQQMVHAK